MLGEERKEKVKKGWLAVRVDEDQRRFLIPIAYLYYPLFRRLLEAARDTYGYDYSSGPLRLPCSEGDGGRAPAPPPDLPPLQLTLRHPGEPPPPRLSSIAVDDQSHRRAPARAELRHAGDSYLLPVASSPLGSKQHRLPLLARALQAPVVASALHPVSDLLPELCKPLRSFLYVFAFFVL